MGVENRILKSSQELASDGDTALEGKLEEKIDADDKSDAELMREIVTGHAVEFHSETYGPDKKVARQMLEDEGLESTIQGQIARDEEKTREKIATTRRNAGLPEIPLEN